MTSRTERGSSMMMAIFIMATLFILIALGLATIQLSKGLIGKQLTFEGQAVNASQAGLVDGLAWFRRQSTQPVTAFLPARDLAASPPVNETDDASVGLVREYEISDLGAVWGRYELRGERVRDVSLSRGRDSAGRIWRLESIGIAYVRRDSTKPYDAPPNSVLGRVVTRSDLQRVTLVPPGNAAICSQRGDSVTTETRTRVQGGSDIGIVYAASTGSPTTAGPVSGSPVTSQADPYADSVESVFGVSREELMAMADHVVTSVAQLPASVPGISLIVVDGDATFTRTKPLSATGVLAVFGNLTIEPDTYSNFDGLIYVTGSYEQNSPSFVTGSIVGQSTIRIRGSGDFSEVAYDPAVLQMIQRQMGQYRFSRNLVIVKE
ncbi:MAG: hypothetical protein OEQ13_05160 [Acidobacteriota bacterium]|nr:hypothetical protein [Acidobacteriota bacterium]